MITDNTKKPQTAKLDLMSYEMWKEKFGSLYANLSEEQLLLKWKEWLSNPLGSSTSTVTNSLFTDNTGSQTTEMQLNKPANNIDLMGATNTLALFGIATGNSDLTKAGILGNSTVKMMLQLKATKGLKGINKTAGIAGAAGGMADTVDQMFFGDQAAKNSSLTNGLNSAYDATSSAIMSMGPYGAMIGGAMKVGGLLSDGLTALGVGTDQMTTTDKILDSKFLKLTPVGLVNGLFSSTSDRFTVDNTVREQIGGSYGGAYSFMDNAASRSGKEYGLFSSGARDDANRDIAKAKGFLQKITDINKEARDIRSIATNNVDLLTTNYQFNLAGGYDQRYIRAAEMGAKIERIKKINLSFRSGGKLHNIINVDTKEIEWRPVIVEDEKVPEFKQGGTIDWKYDTWEPSIVEDEWEPTIELFQDGGKVKKRSLEELIKFAKEQNPRFIQRMSEPRKDIEFIDTEGIKSRGTHYMTSSDNVVYPTILEMPDGSLKYFEDSEEAYQNAKKNNNILIFNSEEEALDFAKNYKEGWLNFFGLVKINGKLYKDDGEDEKGHRYIDEKGELYYFKEGGKTEESEEEPLSNQQNVIPEGALHARKHHMENTEGLTQKGIPVIDDEGEQQAEIELNEIIFNLEVTLKLEELCKDGSDEAAIEAGKLLVQEILFNTEDRTGLIKTLKLGGTINGSTE